MKGLRDRERSRQSRDQAYRERVLARVREAAQILASRYDARRVLLFGSLARNQAMPGSDVDLLVWGLDPSRLFEASAEVNAILQEAYADLVPEQITYPPVKRRALDEGVWLLDGE